MEVFLQKLSPFKSHKILFLFLFPGKLQKSQINSERQIFSAISLQRMAQVIRIISLSEVKCILHGNKKIERSQNW